MHSHELLQTITVWFNHTYMHNGQLDVAYVLKTLFMVLILLPLPVLFLASPFMYVTAKIRSFIFSKE